jgi:hypothetical protein
MPTFLRNILSPSSGLKWQSWEVEGLYRISERKAEGNGPNREKERPTKKTLRKNPTQHHHTSRSWNSTSNLIACVITVAIVMVLWDFGPYWITFITVCEVLWILPSWKHRPTKPHGAKAQDNTKIILTAVITSNFEWNTYPQRVSTRQL